MCEVFPSGKRSVTTISRGEMGEELSFSERLLRLIGDEKPFAWAARNDIAKSSIHNVLKSGRPPGPDQLVKISKATGRSIEWLLTGSDFYHKHKEINGKIEDNSNVDLVWIPVLISDGESIHPDRLAVSRKIIDFIDSKLDHFVLAYQQGDSMIPTISDGDLLLVDQSNPQFSSDGIYLIRSSGVQIAKRLQKKIGGSSMCRTITPCISLKRFLQELLSVRFLAR